MHIQLYRNIYHKYLNNYVNTYLYILYIYTYNIINKIDIKCYENI